MPGRFIKDCSGAAAAEMALVAPLLITLMFGAMEAGYYFYCDHVVVKAVRDGARFASREGFDAYNCTNDQIDDTVKADTQNVTRTNGVDGTEPARIHGWTNNATVEVTMRCDTSGDYGALFYQGLPDGIPIVKVSASVPYPSLFALLGFNATSLQLQATSEAPVMGQ